MKNLYHLNEHRVPLLGSLGDEYNGAFEIKIKGEKYNVIASRDEGWEHVSISHKHKIPSWRVMCMVKDLFFDENEVVMQLHPKKKRLCEYSSELFTPVETDKWLHSSSTKTLCIGDKKMKINMHISNLQPIVKKEENGYRLSFHFSFGIELVDPKGLLFEEDQRKAAERFIDGLTCQDLIHLLETAGFPIDQLPSGSFDADSFKKEIHNNYTLTYLQ